MQVLGYTQASWDDLTGKVTQPFSSIKYWASLTANEKAAAGVMGYNQVNWDNSTHCPKYHTPKFCPRWAQLKSCPDGADSFYFADTSYSPNPLPDPCCGIDILCGGVRVSVDDAFGGTSEW